MAKCPVCDYPPDDVQALLGRVRDPDLLVTLACDFADHVVDRTPDPAYSWAWLRATRQWHEHPNEAKKARREATNGAAKTHWSRGKVARAEWYAARAVEAATFMSETTGQTQIERAMWAAENAEYAAEVPLNECAWQAERARSLACTCPVVPDVGPPGPRGRTSLLAN